MLFRNESWMNDLVSPAVFVGFPCIWVIAVYALVQVMMSRKPVNVKGLMQIYNVVQIVVCGYMVWGLFPCLMNFPNIFGVNSSFDKRGEWFVFVHYLSKYLDWFDTLWIILNKKRSQLSFLHVYHHATIVPVWGLLLYCNVGAGTTRYGAWVNSLTHVIMYTHYLWTSLGLKNPFKRYITMWQITQFYSCLVHAFAVLFMETTTVHGYAWIQVVYQTSMVYLFSSKMSYVPQCVPDFQAKKGETAISCAEFVGSCGHAGIIEDDQESKAAEAVAKAASDRPKRIVSNSQYISPAASVQKRTSTPRAVPVERSKTAPSQYSTVD